MCLLIVPLPPFIIGVICEFSYINVAYTSQRTAHHRQQHTSSVKREPEEDFIDVEASVLLQLYRQQVW